MLLDLAKPILTPKRNRAMQGAFNKGAEAHRAGKSITANPYGDARTHFGGVTFARAFWRQWRYGWQSVPADVPDRCSGDGGSNGRSSARS